MFESRIQAGRPNDAHLPAVECVADFKMFLFVLMTFAAVMMMMMMQMIKWP